MSFFEETLPKWAAVAESDAFASGQQVPCKLFLDATVQLIKIFDSIYGMGMVKDDIDGNRAKIEANLLKLPADAQPTATLQSMCRAELAATKGDAAAASVEGSTCLAILWLKRALLLVEGMLEALVADAKAELADCVNKGYEKGLKMHHNMIMKGVFNTVRLWNARLTDRPPRTPPPADAAALPCRRTTRSRTAPTSPRRSATPPRSRPTCPPCGRRSQRS